MTVSPLRIRWLAVVAVLAIVVVLSACSDDPAPTPEPTAAPTATPTVTPTSEPTVAPTATPTDTPRPEPTAAPTAVDRAALVALYEATDGVNWTSNDNWLSNRPIGEWHGVITDPSGRVTELDLYDNQLRGEIPVEVGNLSSLTVLDLLENQLTGEIPAQLGSLISLERLNLRANQLSGEIPEDLGSLASLERLDLYDNRLSGEIPEELGNLANLEWLDLGYNQLSGVITEELGNLTNLEWLDLSYNQLSGEIPAELGNLSDLLGLGLYGNQLSGEVPAELGSLVSVELLYLADNQLSGEIPEELGNLSNLTVLNLRDNQLSGEIPAALGNLFNLQYLGLSSNQLSGCVPDSLRDQLDIYSDLGGLPFCGAAAEPAPTARPAMPAVDDHANAVDDATAVTLWEAVKGSLDYEGDIDLFMFQAEKGQSYRIDVALGNLSDSDVALLDANEELLAYNDDHGDSLASRIDWVAPSSGEYYVAVSGWGGTGSYTLTVSVPAVPAATPTPLPTAAPTPDADDRTTLVALYEATNGANWRSNDDWLSDRPIGEWHGVTTDRSGRVTKLSLDFNQLSGEIPGELGSLVNLQELLLSENQLSGEIPAELGNLTNLEWLGLGRNRLSGEIPGELGSLANLQHLFLSENQLSGEIPAELGNFSNLVALYLSANQLSGEIPAELGNLPNLLELYLSGNRLTRCLPEGLREIQESDLNIMSIRPPLCGTTPASMIAAGGTIAVLQSLESLSDAHRRAGTEFEWSQVSGPLVELLDANAEYARFTAPVVVEDTILVFVLKAEYQNDVTVIDTVPIRVVPMRTERVLAALVDFLDVDPRERPFTREDIVKLLEDNDDSLGSFISQTSRNLVNIDFDVLDWITVDKNRTDYPLGGGTVVEDVVSRMSDFADLSQYDKVMPLIFPIEQGYPGCQAYLDKVHWNTPNGRFRLGALWLSGYDMGCVEKGRIAHEFGHTFGFVHSYLIDCAKEPPLPASMTDPTDMNDSCYANYCTNDDCTETSPGDAGINANEDFDMLGGDHHYESFFPVHFHATWQDRAGWLAEAQVVAANSAGEYWLTALESLTPTPKAVRIFLGTDHEGNSLYYLVQHREFSPWSMGSPDSGQQVESSCQADVRLEASNIFERGLFNTYFFSGYIDGVSVDSISRPGKPLWDPYRGIRIEILDCIDAPIGGVVRMQVNFSKLDIDPPVVAIFDTAGKATIKMTNNGSVPIDVGSASIGGRHPTAFVVDSDECSDSTMKSKASCEIVLSHVPTDTEDDEPNNHGVLKIPNNDALAPEMTVSLFAANANR